MSFDIRLEDGDFGFGPDGNPVLVRGTEKLKQDIGKVLLTPLGSDPGTSQYGSRLHEILGQPFDFSVLQSLVSKAVAEAVSFLQALQFVQATKQTMDFEEVLGSVDAVAVRQAGSGRIEVHLSVTSVSGLRTIFGIRLGE